MHTYLPTYTHTHIHTYSQTNRQTDRIGQDRTQGLERTGNAHTQTDSQPARQTSKLTNSLGFSAHIGVFTVPSGQAVLMPPVVA